MTARNQVGLVLLAAVVAMTLPSVLNAAERIVLGEYFTNEF